MNTDCKQHGTKWKNRTFIKLTREIFFAQIEKTGYKKNANFS